MHLEEKKESVTDLALTLLQEQEREITRKERKKNLFLAKLIQNPKAKHFMTLMTDECFRSQQEERTAQQLIYLCKKHGIPGFLALPEKLLFRFFLLFGAKAPGFFVPAIKKELKKQMAHVLFVEEARFSAYLTNCKERGIGVICNYLGEAILGEQEAHERLALYIRKLESSEITHLSVKISTLYSQISSLAFAHSKEAIKEKLALLYECAVRHGKKVTLDMEEYKDLALTKEAFVELLDEKRFYTLQAGIVLQSYLPDSFAIQKELTAWAKARCQKGARPIHIRLVKGANLAMEKIESNQRGWPLATFDCKAKTDANYKRMVAYALTKENAAAVEVSIGSHNLFDIAFAEVLAKENEVEDKLTFELLAGMAEATVRTLNKRGHKTAVYTPKTSEKEFHSAIAYLIRRLDEQTAPENFLHDIFTLKPHSASWNEQVKRFTDSLTLVENLDQKPFRIALQPVKRLDTGFTNEPDLDFTCKANRDSVEEALLQWKERQGLLVPLVIGGEEIVHEQRMVGIDPSKPQQELYQSCLARRTDIEKALHLAENAPAATREALLQTAELFRKKRFSLLGVMVADGGKTVEEADVEISEAIDFIDYYLRNFAKLQKSDEHSFSKRGTILVTPPWNFPCSIPVGGIAASLITGNSVLFKPAPETALVGYEIAKLFWEAGVAKTTLQYLNCKEEPEGSFIIKHPKISSVILTGATDTARTFLRMRPTLDLHAETGGKNALIITAMCDRDLAIKDLVASAFGHAGQKCSAASLAILERELYEDKNFLEQLADATRSLIVGSPWKLETKVPPLIRPPEGALLHGLTTLDEGESWLVEPKRVGENPHLWSPGIKMGVVQGSYSHQTEFFGPLLSLLCADNLAHAVQIANNTPYGLTAGLHSLDEREQAYWEKEMVAGNLYINRTITGAIVRRQPFGGCRASSFGPGAKAGGPNYLLQLTKIEERALPEEKGSVPASIVPLLSAMKVLGLRKEERTLLQKSIESYAHFAKFFKKKSDPSALLGEDNEFGYLPKREIWCYGGEEVARVKLLQIVAAAMSVQTKLQLFTAKKVEGMPTLAGVEVVVITEEEFAAKVKAEKPKYLRLLGEPSELVAKATGALGTTLLREGPSASGRIELLTYLQERVVSTRTHRYGYLAS